MLITLKILLGLFFLILLFLSFNWMFIPKKIMAQHNLNATSPTGNNFIRGDIGGILLAGAIFLGLYLYQGGDEWLWPGVILLGCVIIGRTTGLVLDGNSKKGVQAIIVEVIIIALLFGIRHFS